MSYFSIIIPSFNEGNDLKRCLNTIGEQSFVDVEIIVVDGGSSDNTLTVLEEFQTGQNKLKFISEPDGGIYDAMNKGIRMSSGKYLYFIGVDDSFFSRTVLERVHEAIRANGNPEFIYGNVLLGDSTLIHNGEYNLSKLFYVNICHQSIFYSQAVFEKIGYYNCAYPVYADWDFNFRCFSNRHISKKYINALVAKFSLDGMSSKTKDNFLQKKADHFLEIAKGASAEDYYRLRMVTLNSKKFIDRVFYIILFSLSTIAYVYRKLRSRSQ
jgi:glycosyltransferase involved in cell wall biosynthesis